MSDKSNNELFTSLSDLAYDIKERITEYEYIKLMNLLKVMYERFGELNDTVHEDVDDENVLEIMNDDDPGVVFIPPPQIQVNLPILNVDLLNQDIVLQPLHRPCTCVLGDSQWCNDNLERFIACKNYDTLIQNMPLIKFALHYLQDQNYQHENNLPHIQLEPIGYDIENTNINRDMVIAHISCCLKIINFVSNNRKYKALISLCIFEYNIRNMFYCIKYNKYLESIINKINEFILDEIVIFNWISNIFNINQNILYTYKDIFERVKLQQSLTTL